MATGTRTRLAGADAPRCRSAPGALTAATTHVEQVVRHLEPTALEECRDFALDQTLELRARFEVGDDAALHAHQVMMVVLRELLGQFVTVSATRTGDSGDHPGLDEFGEVSVRGGHRDAGRLHHLVGRQRTAGRLERAQHGAAMCSEPHTVARQRRLHGHGGGIGESGGDRGGPALAWHGADAIPSLSTLFWE